MTALFHSRQSLGLAEPNLAHLSVRQDKIRGLVVHWIGADPEGPHPSTTWRHLQDQAMSGVNVNHTVYGDIEYNAAALQSIAHPLHGSIFVGRDAKYVGGHAWSTNNIANRTLLGVAVIGDVLTPGVVEALNTYLYCAVMVSDHAQPFVLEGHHELVNVGGIATACPGAIDPWVTETRARHGYVTL